jgi:transcriptional regulator with XRE-family HTH domain
MDNIKTGQLIAAIRKSKSMTQQDIADKLNITSKAVSKWERGLSFPDVGILEKLADILDITVMDLLNGDIHAAEIIDVSIAERSVKDAVRLSNVKITKKAKSVLFIGVTFFSIAIMLLAAALKYSPPIYEISKGSPDTMGNEVVNNEILGLLSDMYNNSEYVYMQKQIEDITYPSKKIDDNMFKQLTEIFSEYEWRANRTLNDFSASDFNLFIEIYTPDMAQVLTLYGGYDLVLYKDNISDYTMYFTYIIKEEGTFADLSERLKKFMDK